MRVSKRCFVSGRVQGVFYRASAAAHAKQLRVTGHARNLPDGRVEVLACGDEAAVKALIEWLGEGPPAARVSDIRVEDAVVEAVPDTFATL